MNVQSPEIAITLRKVISVSPPDANLANRITRQRGQKLRSRGVIWSCRRNNRPALLMMLRGEKRLIIAGLQSPTTLNGSAVAFSASQRSWATVMKQQLFPLLSGGQEAFSLR
ncbi:hypothetical protein ACOMHN_004388 [Nucella lapillus]